MKAESYKKLQAKQDYQQTEIPTEPHLAKRGREKIQMEVIHYDVSSQE